MSTAARFSDGQYKNWLKCSQSLIIMKEALHDYIDDEVKKLHGDITLKVSSTPCGSSTGNQCGSCSWKNIKLTGGRYGTWYINCKNSICDKWLHEILAVHDDPHNPSINWKNADISMWPTDCYQVAKIFMPKGQERTTKMPDDLDTPVILSLMKYCNWFRKELPNTQILSDLIEIRNKVLHTGDLRVADSDKDSWIDQMIHLLSDLNIHSDAQAELQMLKREDIDFNFQEQEIRALHEMASVLASELTTLKGDMESLQNSQSDLIEDMEKLIDDTAETSRKVDALEADIEQIMKALEELKIIFDEMVSFCEENPDILDKQITETITNTGTAISDQQKDLFRVATALKARIPSRGNKQTKLFEAEKELLDIKAGISLLKMQKEKVHEENKNKIEKHQEETKKQRKEAKTNQEEIRLVAAEQKNNYEQKEAPRKKRPESDDLKLLKAQTEDKLDTLRRLECISTKQAEKAKKLLEGKTFCCY